MKFGVICENVDFVKMCVSCRREHDFQGSERRKIDKKSLKNQSTFTLNLAPMFNTFLNNFQPP